VLAGLTAVACAWPAAAPSSVSAASYEVSACGDSPDQRANNSWELINTRSSHLDSGTECPPSDRRPDDYPAVSELDGLWGADYLRNDSGGPSSNVPAASEVLWRFDAPDGTEITRLRYNRYLGKQDDDDWLPFLRDGSGSIVAGETCSITQGDARCRVGDAGFYPNSFRDIGGLSTDRLEVGVRCTAANVCLNGGSLHLAWATIYASRVTIEDDQDPTITNVQGPLVDDGRASGTEEVSFDAKDNAGAKEVALRVDGNDAGKVALPCDYTYARPCDDFNGPLSLDTTRYSNGSHTVEIRTTDSAGNEASETRAVVFDNPSSGGSDDDDHGSGRGGGGGSGGGSGGGGGGGSSSDGSAGVPPVAAPVPQPFLVSTARLSRGRLLIAGRAAGPVRVSFSYRRGRRVRRTVRTLYPMAGGFRGTIRLPLALRRAPSVSVLVTGSQGTRRVTARARIRRR
jgi:hypothetical protein